MGGSVCLPRAILDTQCSMNICEITVFSLLALTTNISQLHAQSECVVGGGGSKDYSPFPAVDTGFTSFLSISFLSTGKLKGNFLDFSVEQPKAFQLI